MAPAPTRDADAATIRRITGGADVVLDAVGGGGVTQCYAALRPGGRLVVVVGVPARRFPRLAGLRQLMRIRGLDARRDDRHATFHRLSVAVRDDPDQASADLTHLVYHLRDGHLAPLIAARVPLVDAARAHAMLDDRVTGKVLLIP